MRSTKVIRWLQTSWQRYRHILNQTLFYGASVALMKGISLFMLPFIAHQLTPAEFGRLETLTTLAILCSIIFAAGLEDTLYKHVGFASSPAAKRQQAANIYGLSCALVALVLVSIPWLSQLAKHGLPGELALLDIQLILLQVALEACIAVPLGWLRLTDKAGLFFGFAVGRALLQAVLTLVLLHTIGGIRSILLAGLIAAACQAIGLAYYQLKSSGIRLNLNLVKPVLIYALPVIASGLVNFPLAGLDRWLIAAYGDEATLAQVAIAAKFALAGVLLLQPFTMWWSPKRFTVLADVNGQQNALKFQLLGLILLSAICITVAFVAPLLIAWLLPPQYHSAVTVLPFLLSVVFFKEACELVNIGCFSGQHTHTQFKINACTALFCAALMWLSCYLSQWLAPNHPQWLVMAVLSSLMLGQFARLALFYYFSQQALPLNYPIKWLVLAGVFTILALFSAAFWVSVKSVLVYLGLGFILSLCLSFAWQQSRASMQPTRAQHDA
ncbi:lipopolysaccharide biosynthesis protein [Motilimonas sp. KMU-193]|uniref:lipopolysaccharide biosynthesis protein n=1 Tax=Motilimonas sp. KMU-193 TaxID=3388668 RepID=UPI00396AFE9B